MSKTSVEAFSSTFLVSEQDLASEVTKKLLSNGSIVINVYIAFLLLLGSGVITEYHLLGVSSLFATLVLSIWTSTRFRNNSYYLINQILILTLPLLIEPYVTKSWISYGLLIAIFVIFAAAYDRNLVFIFCLLAAPSDPISASRA